MTNGEAESLLQQARDKIIAALRAAAEGNITMARTLSAAAASFIAAALLLLQPAAQGAWTEGVATGRAVAEFDQDFDINFTDTTAVPEQNVQECVRATVTTTGSDTAVRAYDCNKGGQPGDSSKCTQFTTPATGAWSQSLSYARGYAVFDVIDAGAGGGTIKVECTTNNKSWNGTAWVDIWVTGGGTLPGMQGTMATNETINHLFGLTKMASDPGDDGRPVHYFGISGNSTFDPLLGECSTLPGCSTFEQLDALIESECGVDIILEDNMWLAWADGSGSFDGTVGPPPAACGTVEDPAAKFFAASRSAAGSTRIDCRDWHDDEGPDAGGALFTGTASHGDSTGWLWFENTRFSMCPPTPNATSPARPLWSDVFAGNVALLNITFTDLIGSTTQSYSSHGGFGIRINETWSVADPEIWDTGGAGQPSNPSFPGPCVGADDPFKGCTGATAGDDYVGRMQLIGDGEGGSIFISNKTYQFGNTQPMTPSSGLTGVNAMVTDNYSDTYILGPTFRKDVPLYAGNPVHGMSIACSLVGTIHRAQVAYTQWIGFDDVGSYQWIQPSGTNGTSSRRDCMRKVEFYRTKWMEFGDTFMTENLDFTSTTVPDRYMNVTNSEIDSLNALQNLGYGLAFLGYVQTGQVIHSDWSNTIFPPTGNVAPDVIWLDHVAAVSTDSSAVVAANILGDALADCGADVDCSKFAAGTNWDMDADLGFVVKFPSKEECGDNGGNPIVATCPAGNPGDVAREDYHDAWLAHDFVGSTIKTVSLRGPTL